MPLFQNESECENEFSVQFHFHANQSHFDNNGFALRRALKQRHTGTWKWPILYFPIPHNALCLPTKFCINNCCEMLLGGVHIPKSIHNNSLCKTWGANRVHYGELENRELKLKSMILFKHLKMSIH